MRLITAPASEPVTLAEVRASCRVTSTAEDSMLTAMITAARMEAENLLRRCLISQTWEQRLDRFPCGAITLERNSVQSVTSVVYIDTNGDSATLSTSVYALSVGRDPAQIRLKYLQDWPTDIRDEAEAVRIQFVAGYGSTAADVPEPIQQWIIQRVTTMWAYREQIGQPLAPLPFVDSLLDPYRLAGVY